MTEQPEQLTEREAADGVEGAPVVDAGPKRGIPFTTTHARFLARSHATCNGLGYVRFAKNIRALDPETKRAVVRQEPRILVCGCVGQRLKRLGLAKGARGLVKHEGALFFPADFGPSNLGVADGV
jgi:hypothetical protein